MDAPSSIITLVAVVLMVLLILYACFQENGLYRLPEHFDIVVLIGPEDVSQINQQLEYTIKNTIGYRNIYLLSFNPNIIIDIMNENIIIIDEAIFPFRLEDVTRIHSKNSRNGWYLQQLLKLYSGIVIPGIMDRYLVIDCDTFLLKEINFIDYESNLPLYATGSENHSPYFEHMSKLHPFLEKHTPNYSGVCHHMLFETNYVKELMELVETYHDNQPFWVIFLAMVDSKLTGLHAPWYASGASEYEIYFNYMLKFHPDKMIIRQLKWKNCGEISPSDSYEYDYVSCHHYMRNP